MSKPKLLFSHFLCWARWKVSFHDKFLFLGERQEQGVKNRESRRKPNENSEKQFPKRTREENLTHIEQHLPLYTLIKFAQLVYFSHRIRCLTFSRLTRLAALVHRTSKLPCYVILMWQIFWLTCFGIYYGWEEMSEKRFSWANVVPMRQKLYFIRRKKQQQQNQQQQLL